MKREADFSLARKYLVEIGTALILSAMATVAHASVQIMNDWRDVSATIPELTRAINEKTADRWTKTDHEAYAGEQARINADVARRLDKLEDRVWQSRPPSNFHKQ